MIHKKFYKHKKLRKEKVGKRKLSNHFRKLRIKIKKANKESKVQNHKRSKKVKEKIRKAQRNPRLNKINITQLIKIRMNLTAIN